MKESLKKAQANYNKKCRLFQLRVNKETEADIDVWLNQPNAGTKLKALIRRDIQEGGPK